ANGNIKQLLQYANQTVTPYNSAAYLSDADGHILEKRYDNTTTHSLIVNGQLIGSSSDSYESFSTVYDTVTAVAASNSPGVYMVQTDSQTLQEIAKALWGDQNLWYLLAEANGGLTNPLKAGQELIVPAKVNTVTNTYETFKPYNKAAAVGSTTPELAMPAPQSGGGGGCGAMGKLVMVVVAVAVTVLTQGAAVGLMGEVLGTAAAAAAGSVASQVVGQAIGAQDGFSWKAVAQSAIGGAISAGVSEFANSLSDTSLLGVSNNAATTLTPSQMAARAAISSTLTQGVGMLTGMQSSFSWANVAGSYASAYAGGLAGEAMQRALQDSNSILANIVGSNQQLAVRTANGFAAGATASILRGGKINVVQIATDAFGNALGSSLADNMNPSSMTTTAQGTFADSIGKDPAWLQNWKASNPDTASTFNSENAGSGSIASGSELVNPDLDDNKYLIGDPNHPELAFAPGAGNKPQDTSMAGWWEQQKKYAVNNRMSLLNPDKTTVGGWIGGTLKSAYDNIVDGIPKTIEFLAEGAASFNNIDRMGRTPSVVPDSRLGQFLSDDQTSLSYKVKTLTLGTLQGFGDALNGDPEAIGSILGGWATTKIPDMFVPVSGNRVGTIRILDNARPNSNELRAGQAFADMGYDVMHLEEAANKGVKDVQTPDLLVGPLGTIDVYTPQTTNPSAILRTINDKKTQASSVVVQTNLANSEINSIVLRAWGKPNLPFQTLYFQNSENKIIRFDRPKGSK
ncbi:hypothetical protein, partial [Duganella guangzhouensis]|uniref:hypothetical protein n=1 Tax=Duganella guangzhouensis TaxID=2666084 RepID=UPI0018A21738